MRNWNEPLDSCRKPRENLWNNLRFFLQTTFMLPPALVSLALSPRHVLEKGHPATSGKDLITWLWARPLPASQSSLFRVLTPTAQIWLPRLTQFLERVLFGA